MAAIFPGWDELSKQQIEDMLITTTKQNIDTKATLPTNKQKWNRTHHYLMQQCEGTDTIIQVGNRCWMINAHTKTVHPVAWLLNFFS